MERQADGSYLVGEKPSQSWLDWLARRPALRFQPHTWVRAFEAVPTETAIPSLKDYPAPVAVERFS